MFYIKNLTMNKVHMHSGAIRKFLYGCAYVKPQLHCHDFGHDGATTHPDLSSRDASA